MDPFERARLLSAAEEHLRRADALELAYDKERRRYIGWELARSARMWEALRYMESSLDHDHRIALAYEDWAEEAYEMARHHRGLMHEHLEEARAERHAARIAFEEAEQQFAKSW